LGTWRNRCQRSCLGHSYGSCKGARNSCATCRRKMRSMCLQAMTTSAQDFKRKCASHDNISFLHSLTVWRASSPSCSLRALLTLLVRVGFSSTRVSHPLSRIAREKKKKTWLGLKGDQCEQTFYNGGWSQSATFILLIFLVQRQSGCDVFFL